MRHVSSTQRITLDLFFDRINFDVKIQKRYVDTKNQLSDILPKDSFSEDEWNNLLRLKNIMNVCTFHRSHFTHFNSVSPKIRDPCRREDRNKISLKNLQWLNQSQWSPYRSKISPIILMSEASTNQVVCIQEVTSICSWANLKVLGEEWECRLIFAKVSNEGQRLNWTRLTMSDTSKWKYNKIIGALKLGNEIALFLPTIASDNGQRNRWVRQTSKQNS